MLLQSDATYLVVTDDGQIEKYGLNAVCTHLGCVVPWNNVSANLQFPSPWQAQCFLGVPLSGRALVLSVDLYMQNEKKFKCPCHGSQYNREGKVVRGPAPLVSRDTIICYMLWAVVQ